MDGAEVLERVREVVSDVLGLPAADIDPDDRLMEDLEAEKPQVLELLDALEEEFDVEINEEELLALSTVGEVVELIASIIEEEEERYAEEEEKEDYDEGEEAY